ncbi:MAG: AtpZ/AtpI family protein [Myxococcota bacterium]
MNKTNPSHQNKKSSRSHLYKIYVVTSAVGLEIVLSITVGIFAGLWLDKRYHTAPWGLLGGGLIGAMAAARALIVFTRSYLR